MTIRSRHAPGLVLLLSLLAGCSREPPVAAADAARALPSSQQVDAEVQRMMQSTGAKGFALAVIDSGEVRQVSTYGQRNAAGAPLTVDSILYGASLTKMAVAYTVLQLSDAGIVNLDRPIREYLPLPLPDYAAPEVEDRYARWSDLAGDNRWQQLTPRILLNHSSGFANFGFLEPDGKLRFHFEPGTRYSYSGDGIMLLQFVLEQGLGLDLGKEMQQRLFDPLRMANTSLIWRDDFAGRVADGWTSDGTPEPHDERSMVRAAGSMDTTIADSARLAAAIVRGELLSTAARIELTRPQLAITSASQFPVLQPDAPPDRQRMNLSSALGVIVFEGPQGRGFFKGGHNDSTGNMLVCLTASQRCVVILGNDLRAEPAIPWMVDFILGPTGLPWNWEYGGPLWKPDATRPAGP
jgi:CubicO group peptidase (beta-lactamase class C family)